MQTPARGYTALKDEPGVSLPKHLIIAMIAVIIAMSVVAASPGLVARGECLEARGYITREPPTLTLIVRNVCKSRATVNAVTFVQNGVVKSTKLNITLEPHETRVIQVDIGGRAPLTLRLHYEDAAGEHVLLLKVEG